MLRKLPLKIIVPIAVLIIAIVVAYWFYRTHMHKSVASKPGVTMVNGVPGIQSSGKDKNTIRFIATGDFIAHDSVNTAAKQTDGNYNYMPMISDFLPVFSGADIRFCNDPILNGGSAFGISGYPKFNSPTEFVRDMGKLGCNLVNTASNHSFDKSQDAINASVDAWANVPNMLAVVGENKSQAQHDSVHYFTINTTKVAFLAYTTYANSDAPPQNSYGVNVFNQNLAASQIAEAKQNGAKVIVVSMRWGTEYSTSVNPEQQSDAQFLADQGVNLVLGHGSHELQTVQELAGKSGNKTVVWYSLGNFLNSQEPPETLFNGIAVMDFDAQSWQIKHISYLPIYMHYEWSSAQATADDTASRNNLHLYLLENATEDMLNRQQLKTTIDQQKQRLLSTLNQNISVNLITKSQYLQ